MLASTEEFKKNLQGVSKTELLTMAKPWLEKAGRMSGLKSLYDVPEYFRQRFELKGLKVGNKKFGGGLAGATSDLLDKASAPKTTTSEPSHEVRDAIKTLNKKLDLTEEGSEKHSEARKEMAKILRENRRKKAQNKEKTQSEVINLLDTYTNQKVSGVTAARELVRTGLTLAGTTALMPALNVAFNGADYMQNLKQSAKASGESFNANYVRRRFVESTKNNLNTIAQTVTGKGGGSGRVEGLETLERIAEKFGLASTLKIADLTASFSKNQQNRAPTKKPGSDTKPQSPDQVDNQVSETTPQTNEALSPVRNIQTEANPNPRYQTTDQRFKNRADDRLIGPTGNNVRNIKAEPKESRVAIPQTPPTVTRSRLNPKARADKKVEKATGRAAALLASPLILGAATTWAFVHGIMAILAAILLVLSYLYAEAGTAARLVSGSDNPFGLFLVVHIFVVFSSYMALALIGTAYRAVGAKPTGGRGSALKSSALVLTLILYLIPFINIFPWYLMWTTTIIAKPK